MFLTSSNLVFHLISRGIITAKSVVSGDFTLIEVGRRNRNFKILRREHPGLFVKQIKTQDQQATSTLQREATFYQSVKHNPEFTIFKQAVPSFVDYDPSRYALVLELLPQAENLAEYHSRTDCLPANACAAMGRELGGFHSQLKNVLSDPLAQLFNAEIPWSMNLEQTGYSILSGFGGVGAQLAQAIQQYPLLQPMLSSLRPFWQRDSIVHGDPKWENWMLQAQSGMLPNQFDLKLIDWELIDIGDGAWDVGMIFKEFLVIWLLSIRDPANPAPPHAFAPARERSVKEMQPAIREFWEGYVSARSLTPSAAAVYLRRCVQFTAARLIVAVLEYFFPLAQLNNHAYGMLGLSAMLLQNPDYAASELLGLATT